jgi:mannose-6-phosphate isomerase-like protein (cupin superfamily)
VELAKMPSGTIEDLRARAVVKPSRYLEFLRVPSMSIGAYVLAAGSTDLQTPHTEDEVYYVVRGRGWFRHGDVDEPVGAGEVVFVPALQVHRFHDVESELVLLVIFAPAERHGE